MPFLLGWGATASAITEEIVCLYLELCMQKLESGEWTLEDPRYPIVLLEVYSSPTAVVGIGSGGTDMRTRYAVVLRLEFVPVNRKPGEMLYPIREVYFKILPQGLRMFRVR